MRPCLCLLGAVLAVLAPAAAMPQNLAPTSAEIRQPQELDRRLAEEFKTDEAELIDGLRESADRLERPPDCAVDAKEPAACTAPATHEK